jgi:hypothetical protein
VDERLRRLERQAAAGDHDAAAQLLVQRLRIGELGREGVELAAYLGHDAANRATPEVDPETEGREALVEGLARWGKEAFVRAAVAAAYAVLPRYEELMTHEDTPRKAIASAEAWIACPCEAHRVGARLAAQDADDAAREASIVEAGDDESTFAAWTAKHAALAAAAHDLRFAAREALRTIDEAAAVQVCDVDALVRQALLDWALGGSPRGLE